MTSPYVRSVEAGRAALEKATEALDRRRIAPAVLDRMADVGVGETPGEVVYTENKLELIHYDAEAAGIEPTAAHDVPVLIVYALINRPYILDLQPNRSVVRRLLEGGFDVYLIDWGEPSRLDGSLTLEDYVDRYVHNCVDVVLERSGVSELNLFGYCMGGTMAGMYAALHPDRIRNLVMMAASLEFEGDGGVLELWGDEEFYSPATVAETFGTVPAEFFDVGFMLMDPVANTVSKYAYLYDNLDDEDFVENFARMERWLSDGIDMAGETYRQYLEDIYQGNRFARNELTLGDKRVDIGNLTMPVLQIVAEYDHLVPPEASTPFTDRIPSDDTEVMVFPTGHIGLSVSSRPHAELWPRVCEWLAPRSAVVDAGDDPVTTIDGIGPAYTERLRGAGVETVRELATADGGGLAEAIDVPEGRVVGWIEDARTRLTTE